MEIVVFIRLKRLESLILKDSVKVVTCLGSFILRFYSMLNFALLIKFIIEWVVKREDFPFD